MPLHQFVFPRDHVNSLLNSRKSRMANGVMRCIASLLFSLSKYHRITFFLSNIPPSILSSVYSPPLARALNLPPSSLLSLSPPFLLLARAYVRAPSDFFPVFTHRSFFPFRNIIGGAMHLSPFPPSAPGAPLARSLASSGEDRAASLAHPASLTSANPGRVPATR